jgi:subtilisin
VSAVHPSALKHLLLPVLLALLVLRVPVPISAQPDLAPELLPLLVQAQQTGSVRVIVELAVPFQPEGALQSASAQRSAIGIAQAELLNALASYNPQSVIPYQTIPYLALTVDEAALRALAVSALVTRITPDLELYPVLDSSTALIGAPAVWASGVDGSGQTVAVLDTGIQNNHPFLNGKVVAEGCFSTIGGGVGSNCPNGLAQQIGVSAATPCSQAFCFHGTHVAGIAAGLNGSSGGAALHGVARGANLIGVQVSSKRLTGCDDFFVSCNVVFTSNVIQGLEYVYGLRSTYIIAAVNMSLGSANVFDRQCDDVAPAVKAVVDNLRAASIVTVVASGNSGSSTGISAPACVSNVVSVGATTDANVIADFSNSSPLIDLLAPGVAITSSIPGSTYSVQEGTSMAAPHVAGAFALLRDAQPSATIDQMVSALQISGFLVTDPANGIIRPRIRVDTALTTLGAGVPERYRLVINEVKLESQQAIEVYNADTRSAVLTGWRLYGYGSTGALEINYTFPTGFTLAPGAYVVVQRGTGTNTPVLLYMGNVATTWSAGSGGALRLNNGALDVDFVRWGTVNPNVNPGIGTAWTGNNPTPPTTGQTLGRSGSSEDIDDGRDWLPMPPSLGTQNTLLLANDSAAGALQITPLPYTHTMQTQFATTGSGEQIPAPRPPECDVEIQKAVWYRYTATDVLTLTADTLGSAVDTIMVLWQGTLPSLTYVACNDDITPGTQPSSRIRWTTQPGATYYLMIGNYGVGGTTTINVAETGSIPDLFEDRFVITSLPYSSTVDVSTASVSVNDPNDDECRTIDLIGIPFYFPPSFTLWWEYTPGTAQTVNFAASSPNAYLLLAIYTGTPGSLTQVYCANDVLESASGTLTLNQNQTYYIVVSDLSDMPDQPPQTTISLSMSYVTVTNTPTATSTATATQTRTPTSTSTATRTPTSTSTATATRTLTSTSTGTATATRTPTPTNTGTMISTPTTTHTSTSTGTIINTPTLTRTSTATPTPTSTPLTNLIQNGSFSPGLAPWLPYSTPNSSIIQYRIENGVLEFYRVPLPGRAAQALVLQSTGAAMTTGQGLRAEFKLGNSSPVRLRVTILLHEASFSDLQVCTFWLPPGAPLQTYTMLTFASTNWQNTTMSIYASTVSNQGYIRVDDVALYHDPQVNTDQTRCIDPYTP